MQTTNPLSRHALRLLIGVLVRHARVGGVVGRAGVGPRGQGWRAGRLGDGAVGAGDADALAPVLFLVAVEDAEGGHHGNVEDEDDDDHRDQ